MIADLSLGWGIPFVGMLLSIAAFPIAAPHVWHQHFRKVAIFWALLLAAPFLYQYRGDALHNIVHVLVADYLPFVILLWALFTISGGIVIEGTLPGTPRTNVIMIAIGTAIASFVGTTGASMLLIRPLLRANANRRYRVHTVVFFIFLVSNIGGSLTPLGDPPLFLGFLHGVPFFWTMRHVWLESLTAAGLVLAIYFVWESIQFRREKNRTTLAAEKSQGVAVKGLFNFALLAGVIGAVLISGYWKPTNWNLGHVVENGNLVVPLSALENWLGLAPGANPKPVGGHGPVIPIPIQNLARDALLIALGWISLKTTKAELRKANGFSWFPIKEVAWLFFGIFVTIIPVFEILAEGPSGHLGFVFKLVQTPAQYFWATGLLSSFLDNAPTYLTFFGSALGQFHAGIPAPQAVAKLLVEQTEHLAAISIGAVFMGANTYIGNAPNFMVRSIAEEANVRMPNFFAYLLLFALPVLGPTFIIITLLFF